MMAGAFPFLRDLDGAGVFAAGGAGATSGIFCLLDRRPDAPDCEGDVGDLSLVFRFREGGEVVEAADGASAAAVEEAVAGAAAGTDDRAAWLAA